MGNASEAVFFTIATESYFLGLVALINSLRLVGHRERIVVLDCGLLPEQLALLAGHCETARPPSSETKATLYKAFGREMHPHGVSIIIDSDMIVSRRLDGVIAKARQGSICATVDPEADRWFESWSSLFGLAAPLRREPYVNAAFVALSGQHWPDVQARWWALCERMFDIRDHADNSTRVEALAQLDQDALNALIMSELPPGSVERLPPGTVVHCTLEPARLVDAHALAASSDAGPASILHWPGQPKPWLWRDTPHMRYFNRYSLSNPFILLLRRVLTGDDVAIKLPPSQLPLRLRPGFAGAATFGLLGAVAVAANPLSAALRSRRA